ncbi:MAG: aminoacyl-tRNA hydrolase [Proteobacteria bacterium]|jgi:PTH1 family peptidyl-tRNA hydrolase|nr:aminoacyl-tRNA hydrolase [Pseudomonadota bacterium]
MSEDFKLIVGLGNPGPKYEYTLHNVGFLAIDQFLSSESVNWQKKWNAQWCTLSIGGSDRVFLKPQTFMNLSGNAIRDCANFFKFTPNQIMVIHDEVDLEFGDVRLKKGGGAGGHNGLVSTIEHVGADFYRIRAGVGKSQQKDLADYLLEKFNKSKLLELADIASATLKDVLELGFVKAQNNRNKKPVSA